MAPSPPPQALNRKGSVRITARLPCRQPLVRLMSDTTSFKFVAGDGKVSPRLSYVYELAVRFMTDCWRDFGCGNSSKFSMPGKEGYGGSVSNT